MDERVKSEANDEKDDGADEEANERCVRRRRGKGVEGEEVGEGGGEERDREGREVQDEVDEGVWFKGGKASRISFSK
jgi:hypothetical protein